MDDDNHQHLTPEEQAALQRLRCLARHREKLVKSVAAVVAAEAAIRRAQAAAKPSK
jgi:hypothetical protein